jgi:hypothetical protein
MENLKDITPEQALALEKPTSEFLAGGKDKQYGISFGAFRMRDMDSGQVLFEIEAEDRDEDEDEEIHEPIKYHFGPDFLELRNIGTQLTFSVGPQEVKSFRMVERHYFKNKLIKSYDF